MSSKHLATGSALPPKVEGKWRLYSMEYCPYAHRARLILLVKNVPHDIVNVNLINKPEWIFDIHPEGKVPALDTGSKIVVESLDICDFLNDEFPDPPLYSADAGQKQEQKELIQKIGALTGIFYRIIIEEEKKSAAEWLVELKPHLDIFESALEKAGPFFGGASPNMVDFMLWPWGERAGTAALILKEKLIGDDDYKKLRAWRKAMRPRPEVDQIYTGPQKFLQVLYYKTKGVKPDYDNL